MSDHKLTSRLTRSWGKLFSSEEEVISLVAGVLPLVAFFQLTDGRPSLVTTARNSDSMIAQA